MAEPQPIETAPRDGRKVTVLWTDRDGQENEPGDPSAARRQAAVELRSAGPVHDPGVLDDQVVHARSSLWIWPASVRRSGIRCLF